LAHDFQSLFWLRFATGLGLGGALPNVIAMAREVSTSKSRALTSSMMFAALPIGGAGVALYARFAAPNWQSVFILGGVIPLVLAVLVGLLLPETRSLAVADDPEELLDRRTLAGLFGGGRAGATVALWLAFVLTNIVVYLLLNWLPTLAVAKGLPPTSALFTSMAFNLGGILGALLLAIAVDGLGARGPLMLGYAGLVAAMLALGQASGLTAIVALSAAGGFCVLGVQYVLYGLTPIYYPAAVRGATAGAAVAVGRAGSVLGPLIGGALLTAGVSAGGVVYWMAPVALAAGATVLLLTIVGRPDPNG
jgi:AAHS family 3-hydroxyphenylpropionic acid transporter